jgi:hypothetical protein
MYAAFRSVRLGTDRAKAAHLETLHRSIDRRSNFPFYASNANEPNLKAGSAGLFYINLPCIRITESSRIRGGFGDVPT